MCAKVCLYNLSSTDFRVSFTLQKQARPRSGLRVMAISDHILGSHSTVEVFGLCWATTAGAAGHGSSSGIGSTTVQHPLTWIQVDINLWPDWQSSTRKSWVFINRDEAQWRTIARQRDLVYKDAIHCTTCDTRWRIGCCTPTLPHHPNKTHTRVYCTCFLRTLWPNFGYCCHARVLPNTHQPHHTSAARSSCSLVVICSRGLLSASMLLCSFIGTD